MSSMMTVRLMQMTASNPFVSSHCKCTADICMPEEAMVVADWTNIHNIYSYFDG